MPGFGYFGGKIGKFFIIFETETLIICQITKFHAKRKSLCIWNPKHLIWVFLDWNFCHIWNQHCKIFLKAEFCAKIRIPNFGTNKNLFGFFVLEFSKTVVIFEIQTFEFAKWKVSCKTKKALNLEAKIWKNYCDHLSWHPQVLLSAKSGAKIKIFEFGTKNVWYRYFQARILTIVIFEIRIFVLF